VGVVPFCGQLPFALPTLRPTSLPLALRGFRHCCPTGGIVERPMAYKSHSRCQLQVPTPFAISVADQHAHSNPDELGHSDPAELGHSDPDGLADTVPIEIPTTTPTDMPTLTPTRMPAASPNLMPTSAPTSVPRTAFQSTNGRHTTDADLHCRRTDD
jgi:hypothetical protein